jgi:hypothetical protein
MPGLDLTNLRPRHRLGVDTFAPKMFIPKVWVTRKRLVVVSDAAKVLADTSPVSFISRLRMIAGWTDWANHPSHQDAPWTELVFGFPNDGGMRSLNATVARMAADGLRLITSAFGKHVQLGFHNQRPGHSDSQLEHLLNELPVSQVNAHFVFHDASRAIAHSAELGDFFETFYSLRFLVNYLPALPEHAFSRGIVESDQRAPFFDEVIVVTVDDKDEMTARGYTLTPYTPSA